MKVAILNVIVVKSAIGTEFTDSSALSQRISNINCNNNKSPELDVHENTHPYRKWTNIGMVVN